MSLSRNQLMINLRSNTLISPVLKQTYRPRKEATPKLGANVNPTKEKQRKPKIGDKVRLPYGERRVCLISFVHNDKEVNLREYGGAKFTTQYTPVVDLIFADEDGNFPIEEAPIDPEREAEIPSIEQLQESGLVTLGMPETATLEDMANDPAIQAEMQQINEEFAQTDGDGLDALDDFAVCDGMYQNPPETFFAEDYNGEPQVDEGTGEIQSPDASIIKLDEATRFLGEYRNIDDVKAIRDKAEAMRLYAKQAKLGLEAQNYAAEIKLRAERRAGELLAEMPKNTGTAGQAKGKDVSGTPTMRAPENQPPTLADLGISHNQSSRWQQIAKIPAAKFEAQIETQKADGEELTTAGMLRPEGRQKPKNNTSGEHEEDQPDPRDKCQSPDYVVDPLLAFLGDDLTIWEPASGDGLLTEALYDGGISKVITTDLLTGKNFLTDNDLPEDFDVIVTNPPYSTKYDFLTRAYELGKPFALLMPIDVFGSKQAQALFAEHGVEVIFMNERTDFKMPEKGWDGAGAQFSTAWFTWQLNIGRDMTFTNTTEAKKAFVEDLIATGQKRG